MTESDRQSFVDLIIGTAERFKTFMSERGAMLWFEDLKEFEYDEIYMALKTYRDGADQNSVMPQVANVKNEIKGVRYGSNLWTKEDAEKAAAILEENLKNSPKISEICKEAKEILKLQPSRVIKDRSSITYKHVSDCCGSIRFAFDSHDNLTCLECGNPCKPIKVKKEKK